MRIDLGIKSTLHDCPKCGDKHCFNRNSENNTYTCRSCGEIISFYRSDPNMEVMERVCLGKYKTCRHVIRQIGYERIYCNSSNIIPQGPDTNFCFTCKNSSNNCMIKI